MAQQNMASYEERGDLTKGIVRLEKSLLQQLQELDLTSTLSTDNEMYVGGLEVRSVSGDYVKGYPYLSYYRKLESEEQNHSWSSGIMRQIKEIRKKLVPVIEHNNQNYMWQWTVYYASGNGSLNILTTPRGPEVSFLPGLKSRVTSKKLLISNQILERLFTPPLESLALTYSKFQSF